MAVSISYEFLDYFKKVSNDSKYLLNVSSDDYSDFSKLGEDYSLYVPKWSQIVRDSVLPNATIASMAGDKSSIIHQVAQTDMSIYHLGLYDLIRMVNLECYALTYIIDTDYSLIQDMRPDDIDLLRMNLNWISDFCGHYRKYRFLVQYFRDLEIAVGYTSAQILMILNSGNLKQTLGSYTD